MKALRLFLLLTDRSHRLTRRIGGYVTPVQLMIWFPRVPPIISQRSLTKAPEVNSQTANGIYRPNKTLQVQAPGLGPEAFRAFIMAEPLVRCLMYSAR